MKRSPICIWTTILPLALLAGCQEPPAPVAPPAPEVTVAKAIAAKELPEPFSDYEDFTGRMRAASVVEIRARVEGYLLDVEQYAEQYRQKMAEEPQKAAAENRPPAELSPDGKPIEVPEGGFKEGGTIKAGEVLFVIDPEPYELARDAALATLAQSEAKVQLAEANFARYEELIKKDAVSLEEYQRNKASLDIARAQVASDKVGLRDAEINLGYTVMRAPFDGRVDRRLVDPGNLVGAQEKTLLTTLVAEDPIHVYFDVSEKLVLRVLKWRREHAGQPQEKLEVLLSVDERDGFVHKGYLEYLETQVDPATGTALVRGVFDNKEGLLYPGLTVRVRVPGEPKPDAVLVREEAIGTDLGGKYLMVVEEREGRQVAAMRRVALGTLKGRLRAVSPVVADDGQSTGGLRAGETYIVEGLQRVRDSMPVTISGTLDAAAPPTARGAEKPAADPVDSPAP